MNISLPADIHHTTAAQILRRAGYHEFVDPKTHKVSYVRSIGQRGYYPRFHIYMKEVDGELTLDLHLDQKKPSYRRSRAHAGEYDGPIVEGEVQRIVQILDAASTD
jgi:hypothetical protein